MTSSSNFLAFLAILLVLQPAMSFDDHDDHWNSTSILDHLCQEVDCGKGTCVVNTSLPLGFMCQCQSGWSRYANYDQDDDDDHHLFLPCVIPNCTLNYGSCQPAPPPVPAKQDPHNDSAFDRNNNNKYLSPDLEYHLQSLNNFLSIFVITACYWMYCGEGKCTNNGTYRHSCTCNPGHFNLLNISYYPCYSECTIGSDCANLGIKVSNQQATPGTSGSSGSGGSGSGRGENA
ncbi:hypothetical protein Tsubulata_006372 [Turnera subulata]|uniref:EGF-like domain-containing protein n=1 Tax=Turnera subulata TaxID=218843 RepID=A0A9Q0IYS7_9ROSI|nr:hypothetical protein Tsubulata_006372 [Turnera subulata]